MSTPQMYRFLTGCVLQAVMLSAAQAQTTLNLINEYPATSITAEADLRFAKEVQAQSKGAIVIETRQEKDNPYKGDAQIDAVLQGKVQIGTLFGGILGNKDPLFLLSSLPFAVKDFQQAKALSECVSQNMQARTEELGAHLLYVTPWPPSGIWSTKPLINEADVKSLKIRTYDATSKSVFERVGAQSIQLPYSLLQNKLEGGQVNAVLTSGDGGAGRKLWHHLPNFTAISYSIPLSYTLVNKEAWNNLGKDRQAILTKAAQKVSTASWSAVEQRIEENYSRMRDNKMKINAVPPDSIMALLRQAGHDETNEWLKESKPAGKINTCLLGTGR